MFQVKPIAAALSSVVGYANVEFAERSQVISLMVADALATQLPLPTSRVDHPDAWYRNTLRANIGQALNCINEEHVIDMDIVEELVYKLWTARYRLVHEPTHPAISSLLKLLILNGEVADPKSVELATKYREVYENNHLIQAFQDCSLF